MAYPSLIRKMLAVNQRVEDTHCANVALGRQMLAMTNRLLEIELAIAEDAMHGRIWEESLTAKGALNPEGSLSASGARIAPITIVAAGASPLPGAALTAFVGQEQPCL